MRTPAVSLVFACWWLFSIWNSWNHQVAVWTYSGRQSFSLFCSTLWALLLVLIFKKVKYALSCILELHCCISVLTSTLSRAACLTFDPFIFNYCKSGSMAVGGLYDLKDFHLSLARCWVLCSRSPALSAPVIVKQQPCWYVLYTFAHPHVCLNTKSFIFPFAFHFNWPSFHICQRATPLVPVLPPSHHPALLSRWP